MGDKRIRLTHVLHIDYTVDTIAEVSDGVVVCEELLFVP